MKKILLSILIMISFFGVVNAQIYTLSVDGEILGDTVIIYGDPESPGMQFEAVFTNNDDVGADIQVIRHVISEIEESSNYFRWVATYSPTTNMSGESLFLAPGESSPDDSFISYYSPGGIVGKTLIEFKFQNTGVENKFIKIVLQFDTTTDDIGENILNNMSVSNIYPNPASDMVNLNFDFPLEVKEAEVKIMNVLGSVVSEQNIDTKSNKASIDISNINDGIYFYSILINGEIYKTEKLIVK